MQRSHAPDECPGPDLAIRNPCSLLARRHGSWLLKSGLSSCILKIR
jgi:hypothetical protein